MATAIGAYATAALLKTRLGITDSTDDTLIGSICDQINAYIEQRTHRVLAPIASATYLYDGDGGRSLYLPQVSGTGGVSIGGLRAISLLETALYTTAQYQTVLSTQYFLRQKVGMTGPYERLEWTDFPISTYPGFPRGYDTVRITATAGWGAIPDDITDVALTAATRAWTSREAGQVDIVGTDEMGRPLVSRFFSSRDVATLAVYDANLPV